MSLAMGAADHARRAVLRAQYGHLLRRVTASSDNSVLRNIAEGTGVGSQLWRLLESLGVRHTADCTCLGLAVRMNAWGPSGCRLARVELVDQMRRNAQSYGWSTVATAAGKAITTGLAWRLNPLDVYGSLLDEAIRRAEETERALPTLPQEA